MPPYNPQDPFGANLKQFAQKLDKQQIRALSLGIGVHPNPATQGRPPHKLKKIAYRLLAHFVDLIATVTTAGLTFIIAASFLAPKTHGSQVKAIIEWQPTQLILQMQVGHFLLFAYILFFVYWLTAKLLAGITIGQVCLSIYNSALTTEKSE